MESKYLQYQGLKLQTGINRELASNTEERLIESNMLGECGV